MMIACQRGGTAYEVDPGRFSGRRRTVQCSACDYRWSQAPDPPPAVAANPDDEGETAAGAAALRPSRTADDDDDSSGGDFAAGPGAANPDPEAPDEPGAGESGGVLAATEMAAGPRSPFSGGVGPETSRSSSEARGAGAEASLGRLLPDQALVQQTLRQQGVRDAPAAPQAAEVSATEDSPAAASCRLHRPVWRRLPRGFGPVAAIVAMATALALVALLIALRGPILAVLPASAGFYASFGLLPDPLGAGLEIRDVSTNRAREGSAEVLTVSGVVANVIDAPAVVPYLRVSLYDAGDRQLQAVDLPGPRASLQPAEAVGFDVRISDVQPKTRRVRVGFTAPPDPARR